jgi:serine/threonine protein kinase
MIGQTIGHYRVLECLGAGGMGAVYRAQHVALASRIVALKVLSEAVAGQPQIRERFLREAEIMATLDHENIVTLHDFLVLDGLYAIVMELVPGVTLDRWVGTEPVPFERAAPLVRQILAALEYAHQRSVVHRDVKPSNVLVTPEGRVKVTDFGIARLAQSQRSDLTRTGLAMGTPHYMSPEQIQGRRDVQLASDIYSCGVLVHRVLSGRVPFDSDDAGFEILQAHVAQPPPPLRRTVSDVPQEVESAVLRALAKQPEERWPSCAAFSHAMGLASLEEVRQSEVARSRSTARPPRLPLAGDPTLLPDAKAVATPAWGGAPSVTPYPDEAVARWETPQPPRRDWTWAAVGLMALAFLGATAIVVIREVETRVSGLLPATPDPAALAPSRETTRHVGPTSALERDLGQPTESGGEPGPSPAPTSPGPVAAASPTTPRPGPTPPPDEGQPSPDEAALLRAEGQLDAGSPAAALATIEPLLEAKPHDVRALALQERARAAKATQERREAQVRHYEASTKLAEARSLLGKGKIDLAQRSLDEAQRLEPAGAEARQIRSAIEKARDAARQAWAQGAAGQPVIEPKEHR